MTDEPRDDIAPDEPAPAPATPTRPARPVGRLVRIGCAVLGIIGAFYLFAGGSSALDPEASQCNQARIILEDEGVEDADDLDCDDALAQAAALAAEDDDVDEVAEKSTITTFGFIIGGLGLVQVVAAVMTARTHSKGARLAALIATAIGIVFSPLGLLSIVPLGFVAYAILFSADARAVFGEPGGLRRRPPAA